MVFKRRKPRTYVEIVSESFYPRGGWRRALLYVGHRLQRLPDPSHKISRGIAAGVFTSFTPLFGLHFLISALLAWAMRGNILAALLATFVGNPLTFPLIAAVSMELGSWMLGYRGFPLPLALEAFSNASLSLWQNFLAIFTAERANWQGFDIFWHRVLPALSCRWHPARIGCGNCGLYPRQPGDRRLSEGTRCPPEKAICQAARAHNVAQNQRPSRVRLALGLCACHVRSWPEKPRADPKKRPARQSAVSVLGD